MIAVIFYLEDSTLRHDSVEQTMSRRIFDSRNLGATHVFMIDRTQYKIGQYYDHVDGLINFQRFESLSEIQSMYSEEKFVYLENEQSFIGVEATYYSIETYTHPESCIYVSGPDTGAESILANSSNTIADYVNIEAENLWSETAINIVLWDRKRKQ